MFQSLLQRVRAEASGERALESVRAIARFHRVQASPGYDEAARWLCAQLEALNLTPEIETVPGDGRTRRLGHLMPEGWECAQASATLIDGAERERLCDYAAEKLSLILRSAPARGRFRLIALPAGGEGLDDPAVDVRGAIVLTDAPVRRALERLVRERGAAGLLYDGRRLVHPVRDRFDDPDALTYTSFWWEGDEPRGFGFVVSPRRGAELRERLRSGRALELEVEIDARRFATEIPLVSAALPGTSDTEVLVIAHLCHPQPSANDNASGAAAALESARVLAALRARGEFAPVHGVRFLWIPELTGTYAWLGADPRRAEHTVAALNLDMVGQDQDQCGSSLLVEDAPCFVSSFAETLLAAIRNEAQDWVHSFSGPGHYSMMRMAEVPYSGGSDHTALIDPAVGVPCPLLIQWPDRFYHSSHDTPDKCDPRSLALAVRCAATYAGAIAAATDPELARLTDLVARAARVRLLRALDRPDPERAVARERIRMERAIDSLARLGLDRTRLDAAQAAIAEFAAREAPQTEPIAPADDTAADRLAGRPRRRVAAPLDGQRHLLPGFRDLSPAERERWRRVDHGERPVLELAWFACDGRRTIGEIARLVWIECGEYAPSAIAEFFDCVERLGLAHRLDSEVPAGRVGETGTTMR